MKKTIIGIVVVIIIIAIGGGISWWQNTNKSATNISKQTEGANVQMPQNINEQEKKIIDNTKSVPVAEGNKKISYEIGEYTVFYEWNNKLTSRDKVTIYLDDGNSKTELFTELAMSIGGNNPKFQEIKDQNIALLTFSNGDSGWFQKNYHYINVINKNVISIEDIDGDSGLIKISTQKQNWEISTFIKNKCKYFEDGKNKIRDGENSYLTDLTLNDERVNVLTEKKILKCVDPGGLGTGLTPNVDLKYLGISKDLSKIFFSLTSTDTLEFAFDIDSQTISKSTPNNLVK